MLGSGFVRHLRAQGVGVHVWNRTPEKAQALASTGAMPYADAADAARGASTVHICVRDGAAVDQVHDGALPGIAKGTPIVDHTTVEPRTVAPRAKRLADAGYPFLHAPVFMGPPQAESGQGTMLASGPRALFDALDPQLAKMASKRQYLGERVDAAAVYKLMGNLMILATVGGLRDLFALGAANGISPHDAYKLFDFYSPPGQIEGRGKRMAHGDFDAAWTMDMALKDARLMLDAANGKPLPVVDAVAGELQEAISSGDSHLDLAAIAKRSA